MPCHCLSSFSSKKNTLTSLFIPKVHGSTNQKNKQTNKQKKTGESHSMNLTFTWYKKWDKNFEVLLFGPLKSPSSIQIAAYYISGKPEISAITTKHQQGE